MSSESSTSNSDSGSGDESGDESSVENSVTEDSASVRSVAAEEERVEGTVEATEEDVGADDTELEASEDAPDDSASSISRPASPDVSARVDDAVRLPPRNSRESSVSISNSSSSSASESESEEEEEVDADDDGVGSDNGEDDGADESSAQAAALADAKAAAAADAATARVPAPPVESGPPPRTAEELADWIAIEDADENVFLYNESTSEQIAHADAPRDVAFFGSVTSGLRAWEKGDDATTVRWLRRAEARSAAMAHGESRLWRALGGSLFRMWRVDAQGAAADSEEGAWIKAMLSHTRLEEAWKAYEKAAAFDSNAADVELWYELAGLYLAFGAFEGCATVCGRIIAEYSSFRAVTEVIFISAVAMLELGMFNEAASYFQHLVTEPPASAPRPLVLMLLGRACELAELQDYAASAYKRCFRALRRAGRAVGVDTVHGCHSWKTWFAGPGPFVDMAGLAERSGYWSVASDLRREALRRDDRDVDIWFAFAKASFRAHQPDVAVEAAERALVIDPGSDTIAASAAAWRKFSEWKTDRDAMERAARMLQKRFRGARAKRAFEREQRAIATIQRRMRVKMARRRRRKLIAEEEKAVMMIQAAFRRRKGRLFAKATRKRRSKEAEEQENAALHIQAILRGKRDRRIALSRKGDADAETFEAALKIQGRFRSRQARKVAHQRRDEMLEAEDDALLSIQSAFRTNVEQRAGRERIEQREALDSAALEAGMQMGALIESNTAERENKAAVKLQNAFHVRKRSRMTPSERLQLRRDEEDAAEAARQSRELAGLKSAQLLRGEASSPEEHAARLLQNVYRNHQLRRRHAMRVQTKTKRRARNDAYLQEKEEEKEQAKAAIKVQSSVRGLINRRKPSDLLHEMRAGLGSDDGSAKRKREAAKAEKRRLAELEVSRLHAIEGFVDSAADGTPAVPRPRRIPGARERRKKKPLAAAAGATLTARWLERRMDRMESDKGRRTKAAQNLQQSLRKKAFDFSAFDEEEWERDLGDTTERTRWVGRYVRRVRKRMFEASDAADFMPISNAIQSLGRQELLLRAPPLKERDDERDDWADPDFLWDTSKWNAVDVLEGTSELLLKDIQHSDTEDRRKVATRMLLKLAATKPPVVVFLDMVTEGLLRRAAQDLRALDHAHATSSFETHVARIKLRCSARKLEHDDKGTGVELSAFMVVEKLDKSRGWMAQVWRSPVLRRTSTPQFKELDASLDMVCSGDLDLPLTLAVFSCESADSQSLIGKCRTTVRDLIFSVGTELSLSNKEKVAAKKREKKVSAVTPRTARSGLLKIEECIVFGLDAVVAPPGTGTLGDANVPAGTDTMLLIVAGQSLAEKDEGSKSDPYIVLNRMDQNGDYVKVWQSKVIMDRCNCTFEEATMSVVDICGGNLDLPLEFIVYDWDPLDSPDEIGRTSTSLRWLITSLNDEGEVRSKSLPLFNSADSAREACGTLLIRWCADALQSVPATVRTLLETVVDGNIESAKAATVAFAVDSEEAHAMRGARLRLKLRAEGLDKKDLLGKADPYISLRRRATSESSGAMESGEAVEIWRSEHIMKTLDPTWDEVMIPLDALVQFSGVVGNHEHALPIDVDTPLEVICNDWDKGSKAHDLIGSFDTTLRQMMESVGIAMPLVNSRLLRKRRNYKHSGILTIEVCVLTDPAADAAAAAARAAELAATESASHSHVEAEPAQDEYAHDAQYAWEHEHHAEDVAHSGWEALQDDNGHTYYHHAETGASQWECPPDFTGAAAEVSWQEHGEAHAWQDDATGETEQWQTTAVGAAEVTEAYYETTETSTADPGMQTCSSCGTTCKSQQRFCTSCGQPLVATSSTEFSTTESLTELPSIAATDGSEVPSDVDVNAAVAGAGTSLVNGVMEQQSPIESSTTDGGGTTPPLTSPPLTEKPSTARSARNTWTPSGGRKKQEELSALNQMLNVAHLISAIAALPPIALKLSKLEAIVTLTTRFSAIHQLAARMIQTTFRIYRVRSTRLLKELASSTRDSIAKQRYSGDHPDVANLFGQQKATTKRVSTVVPAGCYGGDEFTFTVNGASHTTLVPAGKGPHSQIWVEITTAVEKNELVDDAAAAEAADDESAPETETAQDAGLDDAPDYVPRNSNLRLLKLDLLRFLKQWKEDGPSMIPPPALQEACLVALARLTGTALEDPKRRADDRRKAVFAGVLPPVLKLLDRLRPHPPPVQVMRTVVIDGVEREVYAAPPPPPQPPANTMVEAAMGLLYNLSQTPDLRTILLQSGVGTVLTGMAEHAPRFLDSALSTLEFLATPSPADIELSRLQKGPGHIGPIVQTQRELFLSSVVPSLVVLVRMVDTPLLLVRRCYLTLRQIAFGATGAVDVVQALRMRIEPDEAGSSVATGIVRVYDSLRTTRESTASGESTAAAALALIQRLAAHEKSRRLLLEAHSEVRSEFTRRCKEQCQRGVVASSALRFVCAAVALCGGSDLAARADERVRVTLGAMEISEASSDYEAALELLLLDIATLPAADSDKCSLLLLSLRALPLLLAWCIRQASLDSRASPRSRATGPGHRMVQVRAATEVVRLVAQSASRCSKNLSEELQTLLANERVVSLVLGAASAVAPELVASEQQLWAKRRSRAEKVKSSCVFAKYWASTGSELNASKRELQRVSFHAVAALVHMRVPIDRPHVARLQRSLHGVIVQQCVQCEYVGTTLGSIVDDVEDVCGDTFTYENSESLLLPALNAIRALACIATDTNGVCPGDQGQLHELILTSAARPIVRVIEGEFRRQRRHLESTATAAGADGDGEEAAFEMESNVWMASTPLISAASRALACTCVSRSSAMRVAEAGASRVVTAGLSYPPAWEISSDAVLRSDERGALLSLPSTSNASGVPHASWAPVFRLIAQLSVAPDLGDALVRHMLECCTAWLLPQRSVRERLEFQRAEQRAAAMAAEAEAARRRGEPAKEAAVGASEVAAVSLPQVMLPHKQQRWMDREFEQVGGEVALLIARLVQHPDPRAGTLGLSGVGDDGVATKRSGRRKRKGGKAKARSSASGASEKRSEWHTRKEWHHNSTGLSSVGWLDSGTSDYRATEKLEMVTATDARGHHQVKRSVDCWGGQSGRTVTLVPEVITPAQLWTLFRLMTRARSSRSRRNAAAALRCLSGSVLVIAPKLASCGLLPPFVQLLESSDLMLRDAALFAVSCFVQYPCKKYHAALREAGAVSGLCSTGYSFKVAMSASRATPEVLLARRCLEDIGEGQPPSLEMSGRPGGDEAANEAAARNEALVKARKERRAAKDVKLWLPATVESINSVLSCTQTRSDLRRKRNSGL